METLTPSQKATLLSLIKPKDDDARAISPQEIEDFIEFIRLYGDTPDAYEPKTEKGRDNE